MELIDGVTICTLVLAMKLYSLVLYYASVYLGKLGLEIDFNEKITAILETQC